MADPWAIVSSINQYQPDLQQALGDEAGAFFAEVQQLSQQAIADSADLAAQDRAGDALLALVGRYPAAGALLRRVDPATFGGPAPPGPRDVVAPAAPPGSGDGAPGVGPAPTFEAPPGADATMGTTTAFTPAGTSPTIPAGEPPPGPAPTVPPAVPEPALTVPAPATDNIPPGGPPAPGGNGASATPPLADTASASVTPATRPVPTKEDRPMATPPVSPTPGTSGVDDRLRVLKEQVSAVLGVLLVLGTVVMAFSTVFLHATADFQQAKDVLLVLTGLAGVVLGYYFGRIPSEARADQAQKTAADAQQAAADAQSQTQALADQAEHLADQVGAMASPAAGSDGASGTRDLGAAAPDYTKQMQQLQRDLRDLARRARR